MIVYIAKDKKILINGYSIMFQIFFEIFIEPNILKDLCLEIFYYLNSMKYTNKYLLFIIIKIC